MGSATIPGANVTENETPPSSDPSPPASADHGRIPKSETESALGWIAKSILSFAILGSAGTAYVMLGEAEPRKGWSREKSQAIVETFSAVEHQGMMTIQADGT
ncbi:MAG: hypothetical protein AAF664_19755, partial [Planctomycetota bacterium]